MREGKKGGGVSRLPLRNEESRKQYSDTTKILWTPSPPPYDYSLSHTGSSYAPHNAKSL